MMIAHNGNGLLLWTAERPEQTAMHEYIEWIKRLHPEQNISTYDDLHRWSVTHLNDFWGSIVRFCNLTLTPDCVPPLQDASVPIACIPRWFQGATMNFAERLLCPMDGEDCSTPAIHYISEQDDSIRTLTRVELRGQVGRMAEALLHAGVQKGDRIASYASNVPEVVVFALAGAAIGAVYAAASADFGAEAVIDRFSQIEPKVMLYSSAAFYNGKVHQQMDKVRAVLQRLPSIRQCIQVDAMGRHGPADHPAATEYHRFLQPHCADRPVYQQLPFDHPLYVMFSSGTTGRPKCIVHGAGGTLLQHLKEHKLHIDVRRGDTFLQFTLTGWMMWQWMVSVLAQGAAIVLHDGSPLRPDPMCLWRRIGALKVTHLGISPKYLHSLKDHLGGLSIEQKAGIDVGALRVITCTGSVLPPDLFVFAYSQIKRDMMLASITGGTDILSLFAGGCPVKPVYAGELQCVCLGMQVEAWDDRGVSVLDTPGDLVCTTPFPCMPVYFYNDRAGALYRGAYFGRFGGRVWHHGDYIRISSKTGGVVMLGRSDGTLNPLGVRFGSSEIYNLMAGVEEVDDSLAISYKRPQDTDEKLALFVKLKDGTRHALTDELVAKIKTHIRLHLSPRHVPSHIIQCPDIPYTATGKRVEIAVKRILSHLGDAECGTLANPECMAFYQRLSTQPLLYE